MKKIFSEKLGIFLTGTPFGYFAGLKFLFGGSIIMDFALKMLGTAVLAFISGIVTVMASDLAKYIRSYQIFKRLKIFYHVKIKKSGQKGRKKSSKEKSSEDPGRFQPPDSTTPDA